MINLEIKVPVDDLGAIEMKARAAGAHHAGRLDQEDIFFGVPQGLLKLRSIRMPDSSPTAELIAYNRAAVSGSKVSDYRVFPVGDAALLDDVLSRCLPKIGTVRKHRELWMFGGTRIHLDQVERLGTFVELETEGNTRDDGAMRAEHEQVIAALGLDGANSLAISYAEMLFGSEMMKAGRR